MEEEASIPTAVSSNLIVSELRGKIKMKDHFLPFLIRMWILNLNSSFGGGIVGLRGYGE